MNILQVNKFYHIVGGGDRYFIEVSKSLKEKGHKVRQLIAENNNFLNIIFNIYAYKSINKILDNFPADVVHLHSIYHHLTPSILLPIKKRGIPIVHTLEDYHIISPNYHLFHNDNICEITKPNKFYRAILHKCVKDSYFYSTAEVLEKYTHHLLGWEKNYVDYFIAPSQFMKKKLIEYGLPEKKIIHLPHFIDYKQYKPSYNPGDYILYFGRLSQEKGLEYLIEAIKKLPQIKLVIAGRGNQIYESKLKTQSRKLKNIKFIGFHEGDDLKRLIAKSRFTVLPSIWYEVFGISILESFASGKPVIASNIGGIPETVRGGYNGYLVKPKDVDNLVSTIDELYNNLLHCKKLGKNAREYVEKNFNPENHYEKLMQIYLLHRSLPIITGE